MVKRFLTLIFVVASLAITGYLASDRSGIIETAQEEAVTLPPSTPDRSRLAVVQTLTFFEEELGAGVLVFYDDSQTQWQIDSIELYDLEGNLLVVTWLDRLGTCQVVMDRGFLDPDDPTVEGIMVTVAVGTML
jgi:hypothetical protein